MIYTDTPNTPTGLEEAATSGGAGSLDCATSSSAAPHIGKTDSVSGVYLLADLQGRRRRDGRTRTSSTRSAPPARGR